MRLKTILVLGFLLASSILIGACQLSSQSGKPLQTASSVSEEMALENFSPLFEFLNQAQFELDQNVSYWQSSTSPHMSTLLTLGPQIQTYKANQDLWQVQLVDGQVIFAGEHPKEIIPYAAIFKLTQLEMETYPLLIEDYDLNARAWSATFQLVVDDGPWQERIAALGFEGEPDEARLMLSRRPQTDAQTGLAVIAYSVSLRLTQAEQESIYTFTLNLPNSSD